MACTIARADGIHIGEVAPSVLGGYISKSLCGIGSNPFLDIYWKKTTATQVTCEDCYNAAKAIHDDTTKGQ